MAIEYAKDLAGMTLPYKRLQMEEEARKEREKNIQLVGEITGKILESRKAHIEKKYLGQIDPDTGEHKFEYKDAGVTWGGHQEGFLQGKKGAMGPAELAIAELTQMVLPGKKSFKEVGSKEIMKAPEGIGGTWTGGKKWAPGRMLDAVGRTAWNTMKGLFSK